MVHFVIQKMNNKFKCAVIFLSDSQMRIIVIIYHPHLHHYKWKTMVWDRRVLQAEGRMLGKKKV